MRAHRRKRAATARRRSLASVLADREPRALARERPDHDAGAPRRRREVERPVAEREPDEVALRRPGRASPASRSPADDPIALGDERLHALEQLGLGGGASEAMAACLGDRRDPEGQGRGPHGAGERAGRDGVADPEPGEPVGLGEGAEQRPRSGARRTARGRPGPSRRGRTRRRPRRGRPAPRTGTRSRKASSSLAVNGRAGRVVGGADEDHAGPVRDRCRHRVEVVAGVGRQRDRHRTGAAHLRSRSGRPRTSARRRRPRRPGRRTPGEGGRARRRCPCPAPRTRPGPGAGRPAPPRGATLAMSG